MQFKSPANETSQILRQILSGLKYSYLLVFLVLSCTNPPIYSQENPDAFYRTYEKYKEPSITDRRFKYDDIVPLIERLKVPFEVTVAGYSVERRNIYRIKIGTGPINVLLWSQMHGDEPTATMAIMDLLNFFSASRDFIEFKREILSKITIHILPMLNPDGAERFARRNALGVDLNRDAIRLMSPEAETLKRIRETVNADWGFNLHDQSKYYAAGTTAKKLASFSFLAPAFNYEKEVDANRENAMKLIIGMNKVLQKYIPNQVARYSDAFEPRAFGDNFQKWGTNTVLIEVGGLQGDPEKQELRKLHYVILLHALESIAGNHYRRELPQDYRNIPYNSSNRFRDLIIREAAVFENGRPYVMDIGIKRREIPFNQNRYFYYDSYIDDMGDLSVYTGYEEFNARGYEILPGKVFSQDLNGLEDLGKLDIYRLLLEGYTDFYLNYLPQSKAISQLPVRLHFPEEIIDNNIKYGSNPSFFLTKDGRKQYLIVNGFLWDMEQDRTLIKSILQE